MFLSDDAWSMLSFVCFWCGMKWLFVVSFCSLASCIGCLSKWLRQPVYKNKPQATWMDIVEYLCIIEWFLNFIALIEGPTSNAPLKLHRNWFVLSRGMTTDRTGIVGLYFAINLHSYMYHNFNLGLMNNSEHRMVIGNRNILNSGYSKCLCW